MHRKSFLIGYSIATPSRKLSRKLGAGAPGRDVKPALIGRKGVLPTQFSDPDERNRFHDTFMVTV